MYYVSHFPLRLEQNENCHFNLDQVLDFVKDFRRSENFVKMKRGKNRPGPKIEILRDFIDWKDWKRKIS